MKKPQLQKIIKEEISKILKEKYFPRVDLDKSGKSVRIIANSEESIQIPFSDLEQVITDLQNLKKKL